MSSLSTGALQQLSGDAFLKLFVAQLQHQDPTAPMDAKDLSAQLAQFTTVQKMTELTESFAGLLRFEQMNSAGDMIGKLVSYPSPETGELISGLAEAVEIRDDEVGLIVDGGFVDVDDVLGISPATAAL